MPSTARRDHVPTGGIWTWLKAALLPWLAVWAGAAEPAREILVVRPDLPPFAEVAAALGRELGPRYRLSELLVGAEGGRTRIGELRPAVVVALDNQGLAESRAVAPGLPVLAAMGLGLRQESRNGGGVDYEVAPFTVLTRFQGNVAAPLGRVLAPCWADAKEDLELAAHQLSRAGISLEPVVLAKDGDPPTNTAAALARWLLTVEKSGAHAVLVPADNRLVNLRTLPDWRAAARRLKIPLLTTTEALVDRNLGLCAFAATPDPEGIAAQLAAQVQAVVEDGRPPAALGFEPPVTVRVVLDRMLLRRLGLGVREP